MTQSTTPTGSGYDALPPNFREIANEFQALARPDRLQLLLEYSDELPELPTRLAEHPDLLEPVPECQSPLAVLAEIQGKGDDATVRIFASAPPEAPTTRGFASILISALDGRPVEEVLQVPADAPSYLGLDGAISPLRMRGMSGMLARIKRAVATQLEPPHATAN